MADKDTQIKILLYGDPLGFACETLGVENMIHHNYSEVFTVNFEEVYEYTLNHGIPHNESSGKHSSVEGFHYYKEDDIWFTFFRERGYEYTKKTFDDDEDAKRYIVRTLLQLRGTGLY